MFKNGLIYGTAHTNIKSAPSQLSPVIYRLDIQAREGEKGERERERVRESLVCSFAKGLGTGNSQTFTLPVFVFLSKNKCTRPEIALAGVSLTDARDEKRARLPSTRSMSVFVQPTPLSLPAHPGTGLGETNAQWKAVQQNHRDKNMFYIPFVVCVISKVLLFLRFSNRFPCTAVHCIRFTIHTLYNLIRFIMFIFLGPSKD